MKTLPGWKQQNFAGDKVSEIESEFHWRLCFQETKMLGEITNYNEFYFAKPDRKDFKAGQKLEVVNPENPNEICSATVMCIVEHLVEVFVHCFTEPQAAIETESSDKVDFGSPRPFKNQAGDNIVKPIMSK